jgi:hypothetical protein
MKPSWTSGLLRNQPCKSVDGNNCAVEGRAQKVEALELLAFHFRFCFGEDFRIEGWFELEQMPPRARQFVRHGRNGLGTSHPRLAAPV